MTSLLLRPAMLECQILRARSFQPDLAFNHLLTQSPALQSPEFASQSSVLPLGPSIRILHPDRPLYRLERRRLSLENVIIRATLVGALAWLVTKVTSVLAHRVHPRGKGKADQVRRSCLQRPQSRLQQPQAVSKIASGAASLVVALLSGPAHSHLLLPWMSRLRNIQRSRVSLTPLFLPLIP